MINQRLRLLDAVKQASNGAVAGFLGRVNYRRIHNSRAVCTHAAGGLRTLPSHGIVAGLQASNWSVSQPRHRDSESKKPLETGAGKAPSSCWPVQQRLGQHRQSKAGTPCLRPGCRLAGRIVSQPARSRRRRGTREPGVQGLVPVPPYALPTHHLVCVASWTLDVYLKRVWLLCRSGIRAARQPCVCGPPDGAPVPRGASRGTRRASTRGRGLLDTFIYPASARPVDGH